MFGPLSGKLLSVLVLVSIFSATNGLMLTAPRLYYAMARDGVFFARLARVSERFGTPASAIVLLAVWSAVLAATGTFEQLLTYVVFAGWIFYGLGALSVFASRRRSPMRCGRSARPAIRSRPVLFALAAALIVGQHALSADATRRQSGSPSCCSALRRSTSGVRVVAKRHRLFSS